MTTIRLYIKLFAAAAFLAIAVLQLGFLAHGANNHSVAGKCLVCKIDGNGWSLPDSVTAIPDELFFDSITVQAMAEREMSGILVFLPPSRAPPVHFA